MLRLAAIGVVIVVLFGLAGCATEPGTLGGTPAPASTHTGGGGGGY
ncbi:MAG TPA: hypothetical protein VG848_11530 [Acetobacteraceae bacterium]|jgi:hypothetical protein|nr:hypothetical protein [Acetobacteraceae bacterium]